MDILYYVGSGSHHGNRELLYSLRALEKHCKDIGDVWIVGNRPHFLNDKVKYLWVEDGGAWWQNAFYKTLAAIKAGISKEFLLMNDDFFMLQDFEAGKYPYYHKGEMPEIPKSKYQTVICNTGRILKIQGYPTKHYGIHCPIRIDGEKYKQLEKYYTNPYEPVPVSARCLYGNIFCIGMEVKDNKGKELKDSPTGCYSTTDWITADMFEKLEAMFPTPSKWENVEE